MRPLVIFLLVSSLSLLAACVKVEPQETLEGDQNPTNVIDMPKVVLDSPLMINEDLSLEQLGEGIYVYTAATQLEAYGRVEANGMILDDGDHLIMVDTPWNKEQTKALLDALLERFKKPLDAVIVTHGHDDTIGGLDALDPETTKVYAYQETVATIQERFGNIVDEIFLEEGTLTFEQTTLEVFYPGIGHAPDNIVVAIKDKNILFGGCLIKSLENQQIIEEDPDQLRQWVASLEGVRAKYGAYEVIVPGHGMTGGQDMIDHTIDLIEKQLETLSLETDSLELPPILQGQTLPDYGTKQMIDEYKIQAAIQTNKDLAFLALLSRHGQRVDYDGLFLGNLTSWSNVVEDGMSLEEGLVTLNKLLDNKLLTIDLTEDQDKLVGFMLEECLQFGLYEDHFLPVSDPVKLAKKVGIMDSLQVDKYLGLLVTNKEVQRMSGSWEGYQGMIKSLIDLETFMVSNPVSAFSMDLYQAYVQTISTLTSYETPIGNIAREGLLGLFDQGYQNFETYKILSQWHKQLGPQPNYEDLLKAYQEIFPKLEAIKPYLADGTIINEGFLIGMDHYLVVDDFLNQFGGPLEEKIQPVSSSELLITEFRTYTYSDFELELAYYLNRPLGAYPVTLSLFDPALKTARGAHVGMTRDQVIALFPEMAVYAEGDLYGSLPSNGMISITFFIENNKVIEIKLSQEFF